MGLFWEFADASVLVMAADLLGGVIGEYLSSFLEWKEREDVTHSDLMNIAMQYI
jgi:hypothetical protein